MAEIIPFPGTAWTPPMDFNLKPRYLFILEQYHPAMRRRLIKLLQNCNFDIDGVEVAYLIREMTQEGHKPKEKDAKLAKPFLMDLISEIAEDALLIPMGALCCKTIVEQKSILIAHGARFIVNGRLTIPTLSPLQVIAYPDSLKTFISDLQKIEDAKSGIDIKPMSRHHFLIDTIGKFKKLILRLWNSGKYAFDIESTSLNPFRSKPHPAKVLVISFSDESGYGWSVPIDHKEAPWTLKQRDYIVKMLKKLLEAKHNLQIAHNGQFDIMYLRKVLKIVVGNFNFDTLLAHAVAVTEEKGTHYLKNLAWEWTDMGGYDDPLDAYKLEHPESNADKGGTYDLMPLALLWTYAAADADVTYRLYEQFAPLVEEFAYPFYSIMMPATRTLADIQYNGAPIDMEWLKVCQDTYPGLIQVELDRLREFPEVLQTEEYFTQQAKRRKMNERIQRYKKRSDAIVELEATDPAKAEIKRQRLLGDIQRSKSQPIVVQPVIFNPKSPDHKIHLLFDVMELEHYKRTKGRKKSTDKEVLKDLWFDTKHPIVMALGKYTKIKTLYTMFVENLLKIVCDDGRLRGSYKVAGTETGRLSMSEPNLQQIPRNLKDDPREPFVDAKAWPSIKRLFAAIFPDWLVVQMDYSQAELRVLAALARDPVLMSAYMNGEDVHRRVAAEAFNVPIDEVTDYQRTVAKTINFGLIYGQGAKKLAKTIGCTEDQAREFIRIYFKKLPGVRRWINKTKEFVRKNGFSPSPYGRIRRLNSVFSPEQDIVAKAERQGVNSPIQATASDWTLLSLARITRWLDKNKMLSKIILTVHDSIILLVHRTELVKVCTMVKKIMEHPKNNGWLGDIPVVADISMGKNWGQLKEIKKIEDIPAYMDELWPKAA